MNRRRALWLSAGLAVLLAATYVLLRRRRATEAEPAPATWISTPRAGPTAEPSPSPRRESLAAVLPVPMQQPEQPLPTWVRLGIVAAALLAFFAVSLIATKQV